jgi:small subunit ribosomal protein S9
MTDENQTPEPQEPTPEEAAVDSEVATEESQAPAEVDRFGGFKWGTGRRKTSVARVRVRDGSGTIMVNGKDLNDYFPNAQDQLQVKAPLSVTQTEGKLDVLIKVRGGGPTGQAGAVKMGLARALCAIDGNHESTLREARHLTRDSRMKERKKYGQRGARRRFQFSKR